jgi:hypothetical protein
MANRHWNIARCSTSCYASPPDAPMPWQWHAACHQQADHAAASQQLTDWLVKQMLLED